MPSRSQETQCPKCGADDIIEIRQKLPDGTELHFCSCHKCDEKWWDLGGKLLDLSEVLELTRKATS